LKVAHVTVITPGRCGLYETTRELVAGLRANGVDSRLVDPNPSRNTIHTGLGEDRGALIADMDWAVEADVVVSHSGYDATPIEHTKQPVIHVCHGRPRSTFIGEVSGGTPVYSYHFNHNFDARWKAVVTFWKEHVPYHEVMFPDKRVVCIQSSVDLGAWSPDGPTSYAFGGKRGNINVVCTDAWRDDVDPFVAVNAYALWARQLRALKGDAKLHIYGNNENLRGWGALLNRMKADKTLGEVGGWVKGLQHVYRAADFTITPHAIDVRTVRESMASGCPVVRVTGTTFETFATDAYKAIKTARTDVRKEAEARFNPAETARQFKSLLETV
jgi:glycosyltransferase involved in cell wall biosynthesis